MLEIKEAPPLDADQATTFWIGDPAIDQAASDVARYAATGDVGALVVRPGQTPARVVWRPLDEWERGAIPDGATLTMRCVEAASMGLVSVEGYRLTRFHERGSVAGRIPMNQLRALRGQLATFQIGITFDDLFKAEGRETNPRLRDEVGEVSLPEWFGALILAHSFPRG